ncbi:MAG TPA: bifunctional 4-hydroxy-2-oxoglutarate aldolase/2-dehydro-3-deoxy-phosphogluconate aldolase [Candidatus Thiothrix moscowensis]|uniref:bifunctional 4-hydroxy-2-oxoglutarate aldolase/2-dehydro-3-deoxy-phosphogluconate aldolase n=1 Tax=unclassified Thiothrix TaxID=2636184 RepID=UPI0025FB3341|nr:MULTISPECIES: bifunctional 4-hydroxy-2-oxoglutarate aldolase/2-dehydro-3-deoxy-phosphogluconate aldolase [unclassified Thiothrix]HRJ53647.1 bifunctional 4-hydroxy-2-oxoglutarate aldolase/2-dehydro-3-deoxy-phosphogluconate aldolase [Candidatus Thiothrix moscowensis]HRJ93729.1 bifunctional 4-hydroxy-2-oxoglutarate aldolase/2-dehydro-3-deoxy-phosphogluconate aldolase [Candidatus Thiothrix moscowensis]
MLTTEDIMRVSPIIPVIAIDDAGKAVELAHALSEGGVRIIEVTLRTPAALAAIDAVAENLPAVVVGAGTVINSRHLQSVRDAGAQFAISPGSTPALLEAARNMAFPLLPGVATASEIMQGLELGYQHFKLFPASIAGGIGALRAFAGPFQGVRFCPTGGINADNFLGYLQLPNVPCIGGSWIAPLELVNTGRFADITRLTIEAMSLYNAK